MISGAERLRDFNAQRCDRKVVSFGIFEKKFGFYPAELDRFCVIVFGMRARSLSFVGTRPIDLINSFAWQLPEDSDVNQKLPEASDFGLLPTT